MRIPQGLRNRVGVEKKLIDEYDRTDHRPLGSHDRTTGVVISEPDVHTNSEIETDLATQIVTRIAEKAAKNYPWNAVLIIQRFCKSLTLLTE